jgi:hypothetical protein
MNVHRRLSMVSTVKLADEGMTFVVKKGSKAAEKASLLGEKVYESKELQAFSATIKNGGMIKQALKQDKAEFHFLPKKIDANNKGIIERLVGFISKDAELKQQRA